MDTQQIIDLNHEFTFFTWSVQSQVQPLTAVRGEGVYFWDADGTRYLDFSSQLMNVNAGHGNRRIIEAVQAQVASMAYAYPGIATEVKGRLGQLLAEVTPGDLCKTLFTTGGGEANENAIKFARLYTGRHKLLARYRSFHGATAGALSLTGDPYRLPVEPLISGVVHFMDPYCYRCPFGWTRETCHRECISHVEQVVEFEGPDNIAAIVMEGVTGSNGLIIPPDDYWPRIRALCDKYGILLVSDEVMSGFGRTGKWFGVDHWGVVPDIMTMGKGITSGYVPLGAVIVSPCHRRLLREPPAADGPHLLRPPGGGRGRRGSHRGVPGRGADRKRSTHGRHPERRPGRVDGEASVSRRCAQHRAFLHAGVGQGSGNQGTVGPAARAALLAPGTPTLPRGWRRRSGSAACTASSSGTISSPSRRCASARASWLTACASWTRRWRSRMRWWGKGLDAGT